MSRSDKYSTLSKNTILFTINSFGSKIISFLLVPLYTFVLSTKDYGTADLMTSTAQLLIPLLTLNIQDAVLRFTLDKTKNKKDVISIGCLINLIATVVLAGALSLLSGFQIIKFEKEYILFLLLSFTFGGFYNSIQMYIRAVDKVKIFVISGLSSTLVSCLSNILLLVVVKCGVTGYLISSLVGSFVAVMIMVLGGKLYKDIHIVRHKDLLKEMILYSLPLVINSLAWWINTASDKYIITFFCGVAINGIYSVAYKIPTILSTLQTVFYNAWSVSAITEFDKDDKDGFIGNIYSLFSCISTLGCSAVLIANIYLAKILYAKEFFSAWHCVPFLLLGVTFNGIALFEGSLFTAVKKTKEVSKTTLVGALLNTILNFALIPFFEAEGAAFATMFGYFSVWIARTTALQKIVKMRVDWKRQIVIFIVLSIQTVLAMQPYFAFTIVQIILFIILTVLQFTYIKKLFNRIINKMKRRSSV